MATVRQQHGSAAEEQAALWLAGIGWHVLARNVRLGRDEIDIVARDPGPPTEIVLVEVRSAASRLFGLPEERVDRAKVRHLYRAALAFAPSEEARRLGAADLPLRVDLVVVEWRAGAPVMRHLRRLEPA